MSTSFFILAGGYGIRAKPLSLFRPKPAFPLDGIPLIRLLLRQIEKSVLTNGYINLHYLPEELKRSINYDNIPIPPFNVASGDTNSANAKNCAQFFTPCPQKLRLSEFSAGHASQEFTSRLTGYELKPSGTSLKLNYVFEESLSGSAVLNKAYMDEEYVLIINGDMFFEIPIDELINKIKVTNADGVLLVRNDPENDYSKLKIEQDKFLGIADRKQTEGKMYASIAIFKKEVLRYFNEKSFFTSLKKNNFDIRVLDYTGIWLELGNPKSYYESVFKHIKHIGKNSNNSISDTSYISKDAIVNKSIIWDRVRITGNSNISNSIVLDDVIIDNLIISNKIVFNKENKLTLIDL